ncbi:hypothetical protein OSB04_001982 [Centaurea solstitialis]|uniref:F-box domain-containing protein n=1 Tax=Centaurea solstitialis TaxID=347529 RepID=A0AA38WV55_9ASTR|nr:hypothetical protein OSB04_001982 [Centaurea solstitialis]
MASTSAGDPSSESRNWLEMPEEIMGGMILGRLGAVEILDSVQKVCRNWRRICKDPAMWKVIDMNNGFDGLNPDDLEKVCKQAVDRSCGELIDITLNFGTDDLLDYVSLCSRKLTRLCLTDCYAFTGCGLNYAVKRLPHLETLELSYISIDTEEIEVIGHNCPQLKSFTMENEFRDGDVDAHAIANSMPALRHLKLVGSIMDSDDRVRAILSGCPHLQSLDIRGCFYLHLDGNLEKLCRERIKDFKFKRNNIPPVRNEYSDRDATPSEIDDFFDGIGMDRPEYDDEDDDDDDNDYGNGIDDDYWYFQRCTISGKDDFDDYTVYSP